MQTHGPRAPVCAGDTATPGRARGDAGHWCGRPHRLMSWRRLSPGERRTARASVGSIDARDCFRWNDVLVNVAPGKDDEGCVGTQCCDAHHPPDVPDQCETPE